MIRASAPTRIDLAGGTLDIYPLYLFTGGGLTVNAAIDLRAEVQLKPREGNAVRARCTGAHSAMFDTEESFPLSDIPLNSRLDLVKRLIRFYAPETGFEMTVKTSAPPGAGLGGSSALAVAASAALSRLTGRNYPEEQIANIACNIEAQDMGVPAGRQDHYAALKGGFNAIHFGPLGAQPEKLALSKTFISELRDNTTLCYTGESRMSGNTNWDMFKRFVDGERQTRQALAKIREIAGEMRAALAGESLSGVCAALRREWEQRKRMSPGVSTPAIEKVIAASGAQAAKVCGAGGGGCLVLMGDARREKLEAAGGRIVDFSFDKKGLQVY